MAFMTLKTIVLQIKKTFCNFAILLHFFSICFLVSLITSPIRHYYCQRKVPRGIGVTQSNVFKEFVDFIGFDTEKRKLIFDFCHV